MTAAPAMQDSPVDPGMASGPVIIATRGDPASDGAVRIAAALARSVGASVHLLAVLEPMPVLTPEYGVMVPITDADDGREEALRHAVRDQLQRVGTAHDDWRIEICRGDTVSRVTHTASVEDARVIVTGLGRHQLLDRLFGSETALHLLRHASIPVLAVPPEVQGLPKRAVAAVDFSAGSARALAMAIRLLRDLGEVHLVHVAPRVDSPADLVARWEGSYAAGLEAAFAELHESVAIPPAVNTTDVSLRGEPGRELVQHAEEIGADIIISGSRGHGLVERMLIGSVATGIMRAARSMVFMVPAPDLSRAPRTGALRTESSTDPATWTDVLEAFTKRNANQPSVMTVEDRAHPPRTQETGLPLLGTSCDPDDRRVEVMLGDASAEGRHLTHSIGGVRRIDVVRDDDDGDRELRLLHGDGMTRLVLLR